MLMIVYGAVSALHLYSCAPPEKRRIRVISKCFLMPLLALCYLGAERFSPLVLAAVLCGFLGDVLLLFPNSKKMFVGGLLAFAAGHICYAVHMRLVPKLFAISLWVYIVAALIYLALVFGIMSILKPVLPKKLFVPCLGYMLIIGFMSYSALMLALGLYTAPAWIVFTGSLLFIGSDTLLSFNVFNVKRFRFSNFFVMLPYILAQALIVVGLMHI